jgi:hypothetical protein
MLKMGKLPVLSIFVDKLKLLITLSIKNSGHIFFVTFIFLKKKVLTILHGPLAYPNGLLDLHIETFGRTPWLGDQPDARSLLTQDNTT